jgi:hypothetical protein
MHFTHFYDEPHEVLQLIFAAGSVQQPIPINPSQKRVVMHSGSSVRHVYSQRSPRGLGRPTETSRLPVTPRAAVLEPAEVGVVRRWHSCRIPGPGRR